VGALRRFHSAPTLFPIYAPADLRHGVGVGVGSELSIGVLIIVAVKVG
jgi:hypothetical protein